MPALSDAMREMLNPGRILTITTGEVLLEEPGPAATLRTVCVHELPNEAMVLRMDGTVAQKLVHSARGENRRCDFVLFLEYQGHKYAIFTELKSGENDAVGDDIVQKFLGTDCILDYCASILDRFYSVPKAWADYERRYVLMYKAPSMSKLPTRFSPHPRNDTPRTAMLLAVENYDRADDETKVPARRFLC